MQILAATQKTSLRRAFASADGRVIRVLGFSPAKAPKLRFTAIYFNVGDAKSGALFREGKLRVLARLDDGEITQCQFSEGDAEKLSKELANQPLNGVVCHGPLVDWRDENHVGGAGVGPGGLVRTTELQINEKVLERIEYLEGQNPKPQYQVTFNENVKEVTGATGSQVSGSETYEIIAFVVKEGEKSVRDWVTCTRYWALLP